MNNIYLIIGESGTGKTSICDILEKEYNLIQLQSYTTRPKRYDTECGHTFVSEKEFNNIPDKVAVKRYDGHLYGASFEQIENSDLYTITPSTINSMKSNYGLMGGKKGIYTIYIKTKLEVRYERMINRLVDKGIDRLQASKKALERITNDSVEFKPDSLNGLYDFVIDNTDRSIESVADGIINYIMQKESEVINNEVYL